MAIAYPLILPSHTGIASVEMTAVNAVAHSMSPFSFKGQSIIYPGQMFRAEVSVPAMKRPAAERWIAFQLALRGQSGTFLLGDPNAADLLGTATSCTITGTAGSSTVSATVPVGETLLEGDYIQLGAGAASRLHKVTVNYTGTGAAADLELWPSLRTDATAVAATLSNCVGVFRLASNVTPWSINSASFYGISFSAMEAL